MELSLNGAIIELPARTLLCALVRIYLCDWLA
jgi:hypothetical protein